jgi:hypothetical protein
VPSLFGFPADLPVAKRDISSNQPIKNCFLDIFYDFFWF